MDTGWLVPVGGFLTVAGGVVGGVLVKVWPLMIQSRESRDKAQAARTQVRRDENAEVFRRQNEIIDRLQKQVDQLQTAVTDCQQRHARSEVKYAWMVSGRREDRRTIRFLQMKVGEKPLPVEAWEEEEDYPGARRDDFDQRTLEQRTVLLKEVAEKAKQTSKETP